MRLSLRITCFVLLCLVLSGLFVWHGALTPDPADNRFPGNGALADGELAPGDRVVIAGTVRSAGPDHGTITLHGHPDIIVDVGHLGTDADPGDDVWMHGTLLDRPPAEASTDATVSVENHRAIVRAPWEIVYMYVISFLAGLWILARFVRGWHVSRAELGLVPNDAKQVDDHADGDGGIHRG